MADVRAMLRASRDARKTITHPHALYTSSGKLMCNLCDIVIKHESAWQSHLHSTQHNSRQKAVHAPANAKLSDTVSRKRKASDPDSPRAQDHKKAKADSVNTAKDGLEANPTPNPTRENSVLVNAPGSRPVSSGKHDSKTSDESKKEAGDDLDDFERELAELEASVPSRNVITADATISSAPVSADEIALMSREEHGEARASRDAQLEEEKEDAARTLEQELEDMEGLEQRARRLREKREALRRQPAEAYGSATERTASLAKGEAKDPDHEIGPRVPQVSLQGNDTIGRLGENQDSDDDDDEEDEDDDRYWNFGAAS